MTNPKISIQSNGECTELYIDGVKADDTLIDFYFHCGKDGVKLKYEKFVTDEHGLAMVDEDNELMKERHTIKL